MSIGIPTTLFKLTSSGYTSIDPKFGINMKLVIGEDSKLEYLRRHTYIPGMNMLATSLKAGTEIEIPKDTRIGFKVVDQDDGLDKGTSFFYPEDIKIADEFYYDTYSLTDLIDIDWDNIDWYSSGIPDVIFKGELKLPSWLTNTIPNLSLSCSIGYAYDGNVGHPRVPTLDWITWPDI